ncbi:MAG: stage II sporulation protein M [Candidatus Altiarchaeota archaeon]|nr:stage II sporulation protein M [Candidatus Altiarchaeota archaeon]
MVLDRLVNPQELVKKPHLAIPIGYIFVSIAFFSTSIVFPSEYSIVVIAFTTMLLIPYVIKIFELDELNIDLGELKISGDLGREELEVWVRKCLRDGYTPEQIKKSLIENNLDKGILLLYHIKTLSEIKEDYIKKSNFFTRHSRIIAFYFHLFLGMFMAFLMVYMTSQPEYRNLVFKNQMDLIYGPGGYFQIPTALQAIVLNNLKIMFLCVLLSLFYGAGALLILTYNASIASVLYGGFLENAISGGSLMVIGAYLPHTTIEIMAYLFATVSGGILSKGIANAENRGFRFLMADGLKFLVAAVLLVIIGGIVEVTVPRWLLS